MLRYGKPALLDRIGSSHCVIEASAGTGKTFTLEHLIVQLILEGNTLENILVVTFTKKATLELIARVREKLSEIHALPDGTIQGNEPYWDISDEGMSLIGEALTSFDRATISTIHGFCQQVLKDAAFEGGHLFQQEAISSDEAFDRAYTTLLRTDYPVQHRGLLEVALGILGGPAGLRDLLAKAAKEGDCLDLPNFSDARSLLEAFPDDLAKAFIENRGTIRAPFKESPKAITSRLEEVLGFREKALDSGHPESFWLDQAWLNDKLMKYMPAIRIPGLVGDAAKLSQAMAELANFKAIVVAAFLPPLRKELLRFKEEEGLYDFDDMITLVAKTLEGPMGESLVKRLRERYKVALIDEFQDTDSRQWEIFSRIFLGSPDGHRLILVGDPKQAIYGFRGGDLPTYVQALEEVRVATGQEPQQLTHNFRSTPRVIKAYNALFQSTEAAPFFTGENAAHYHQAVTCGKEALRLTDAAGQDLPAIRTVDIAVDGDSRSINLAAATALARTLKNTIETGRFNAKNRPRPELGWEDVFILTKTLWEGRLMARALKEIGIPFSLYRQEGLFDGPEAKACRDILLAIESPFDECRRAKAFLGPFFGLSFEEAERARDLPEGHPLLARLFSWRELALQGRYGELFNRLVSSSGMSQRLLFLDESHRYLTNLLHILELLQQEALEGYFTLADLAIQVQRWIDDRERPSVEDGETQRMEREGGASQILTMHKSKGLQAPIVVLFGGTSQGKVGDIHRYHSQAQAGHPSVRRAWVGSRKTAPAEVQAAIEAEEREEAERLAYVALTRAEAQLLLPRFVPGAKAPAGTSNFDATANPKKGPYRSVNVRLRALLGSTEAPTPVEAIERIQPTLDPPPEGVRPAGAWEISLPPSLDRPDYRSLGRKGRPTWVFSYSGLQKGLERIWAEEGTLEEVKEFAPSGGPRGGKKLGTQVHAFLQRVDLKSFEGKDLDAWMVSASTLALANACLPREGRKDALNWVYQAMTIPIPLPEGGEVVLSQSDEFLREMDFLTPYPEREDFLTGSMDVLFQAQGRAFVLDWKTNRLAAFDSASLDETVQNHYLLQVKIYAMTACRFLGIKDREHYEREFGGVVYVFLRGLPEGGLWTFRPTWEELQAWEMDIGGLRPERMIPVHAGGERDV
jgi:exodeoxyribonuclease V beta subunit